MVVPSRVAVFSDACHQESSEVKIIKKIIIVMDATFVQLSFSRDGVVTRGGERCEDRPGGGWEFIQ